MEKVKKMNQILSDYDTETKITVNSILKALKESVYNYQELEERLKIFKKETFFKSAEVDKYMYLFKCIDRQIDKEKNSLPMKQTVRKDLERS